jgi:class 3 adenylate cyclase
LATARLLAVKLDRLPLLDFGIGVSAGPVFAGNIGAENRYEYTVVGDAVNEAARLADVAKTTDGRILCSGAAIEPTRLRANTGPHADLLCCGAVRNRPRYHSLTTADAVNPLCDFGAVGLRA